MDEKVTDQDTITDEVNDDFKVSDADVELPEWMRQNVPEPRHPAVISYDESSGAYRYTHADNGMVKEFASTEEAYDYAHSTGEDFTFEGEFPDCDTLFSGMLTTKTNGSKKGVERFSRMLMASTDEDKLQSLHYHYRNFLALAQKYRQNPEDFMTAYAFVRSHPAMWIKQFHPRDTDETKSAPTYNWNTDNSDIWCEPMVDDDGVIRWALETGAHTPEYTERYHDFRLDVWNESIEGAYIDLAAKIDKFFHEDGTERTGVEYTKSKLELMLESRMKQAQEAYAEDFPGDNDDDDNTNTDKERYEDHDS
jgi:hypothetical protein